MGDLSYATYDDNTPLATHLKNIHQDDPFLFPFFIIMGLMVIGWTIQEFIQKNPK